MEKQDVVYFENAFEVTKPIFKRMTKISPQKVGAFGLWFERYVKVICVLLAIMCLGHAWVQFFQFDRPSFYSVFPLSIAILLVLFLIFFIRTDVSDKVFEEHKELTGESSWFYTAKFGDKINTQGRQIYSTPYDNIRCIEEDDEFIHLWSSKLTIIVRKDSFTVGTLEDFRDFIIQKCSEKEPLLSPKKYERRYLKQRIRTMTAIVVSTLGIFIYFTIPLITYFTSTTSALLTKEIERYWEDDVEIITTVEVDGGAAVFGTDGNDTIHTMLFSETRYGYNYVKGFYQSITTFVEYNQNNIIPFESSEDWFSFSRAPTIVFGITTADWWDENPLVATFEAQYLTERFTNGNTEFILYYRFADDDNNNADIPYNYDME